MTTLVSVRIERAAAIAADMYISRADIPQADAQHMVAGMAIQIAALLRKSGRAQLRRERDYGEGKIVQMGRILLTAERVEEFDADGKSLRVVEVP